MATRLYLPSSGAVDIAPAFASFTETDLMDRLEMSVHKRASAMTNKTTAQTATGAGSAQGIRQYISPPLVTQTIAGNFECTIRGLESAVNDNIDALRVFVRKWQGQTQSIGVTALLIANGTVAEFSTSLRGKRVASTALTSVAFVDGDRLIFDVGYTNTTAGTSITGTLNFGDNSASDLTADELDTGADNPWIEFSQDLIWLLPDRHDIFRYQPFLAQ